MYPSPALTAQSYSVNILQEPATSPVTAPPWHKAAYIVLAVVVLILAGLAVDHYATSKSPATTVALWSPSHASFCGAITALGAAGWVAGHLDVSNEPAVLAALENLAVYAPSKVTHTQFASLATTFSSLSRDPAGITALNNNATSNDPRLKDFRAALQPLTSTASTPARLALVACSTPSTTTTPRTTSSVRNVNTASAVALVTAVSRSVHATGLTGHITLAQVYEATRTKLGVRVAVMRPGIVKITFAPGPPVCVTLPVAGAPTKAVTC